MVISVQIEVAAEVETSEEAHALFDGIKLE